LPWKIAGTFSARLHKRSEADLLAVPGFDHPHNATAVAPSTLAPETIGAHLLAKHRNGTCKTGQRDTNRRILTRAHPAKCKIYFPRHFGSPNHREIVAAAYYGVITVTGNAVTTVTIRTSSPSW
jgi:hypothetical protein